jgi:hypothetical protein
MIALLRSPHKTGSAASPFINCNKVESILFYVNRDGQPQFLVRQSVVATSLRH